MSETPDICERLRGTPCNSGGYQCADCELRQEAADEIERLREKLERLLATERALDSFVRGTWTNSSVPADGRVTLNGQTGTLREVTDEPQRGE
jgi:hypothetical protein